MKQTKNTAVWKVNIYEDMLIHGQGHQEKAFAVRVGKSMYGNSPFYLALVSPDMDILEKEIWR